MGVDTFGSLCLTRAPGWGLSEDSAFYTGPHPGRLFSAKLCVWKSAAFRTASYCEQINGTQTRHGDLCRQTAPYPGRIRTHRLSLMNPGLSLSLPKPELSKGPVVRFSRVSRHSAPDPTTASRATANKRNQNMNGGVCGKSSKCHGGTRRSLRSSLQWQAAAGCPPVLGSYQCCS